jgi:hypothetical protein
LEGEVEYSVAHFALQKLHILPSQFCAMSREEKTFVYSSILVRIEAEKEEADKSKRATKSKGR